MATTASLQNLLPSKVAAGPERKSLPQVCSQSRTAFTPRWPLHTVRQVVPRAKHALTRCQVGVAGTQEGLEKDDKAAGRRSDLRVVVIGAGPAGAFVALLLARQGFQVEVFERNEWGPQGWVKEQISWNVALVRRAFRALEEVGLLEPFEKNSLLIKYQASLSGEGQSSKMLTTGGFSHRFAAIPDLTAIMVREGLSKYSGQITYHFGWKLESLDVRSNTATFARVPDKADEARKVVQGDLIIGADGVNSVTRQHLEAQVPDWQTIMKCEPTGKAARIVIPEDMICPEGQPTIQNPLLLPKFQFDDKSFFIWRRPPLQIAVLPSSRSVMGFNFQGLTSRDPEGVAKELKEHFPEVASLFPPESSAVRHLAESRELRHCTVRNPRFHHDRIVLIGDAAHACLNWIGIGTNLALEDGLLLESLLKEHLQKVAGSSQDAAKVAIATALADFTAKRKPETDAAAEISEAIPKANQTIMVNQYTFMQLLSKLLPGVRPWQQSKNETLVPISTIKRWRELEGLGFRAFALFVVILLVLVLGQGVSIVLEKL